MLRMGKDRLAAALEAGVVHVEELVLVKRRAKPEVEQRDGRHERLDDAVHQAQQHCDRQVRHLCIKSKTTRN